MTELAKKRPEFRNINAFKDLPGYRWPLAALVSGMHRASGLVMFLLLPWSGFAVPVLGVWYILFLAIFLLYDKLNEAFRIEEQIGAQFPEQIPIYDDETEE